MIRSSSTVAIWLTFSLLQRLAWGDTGVTVDPTSIVPGTQSVLVSSEVVDDREVYIVTSMLKNQLPKIGPLKHASIAICPKGVSPVVYENGVPVSNCRECELYGTQAFQRGFKLEKKRVGVTATKVCGISAATAMQRMRNHCAVNVPLFNDCRHHVIQALGIRNRHGRYRRPLILK
ncbi:MAG: hypothetical protein R3C05_27815 [Pirellulaceae bacterium]